MKEKAAKGPDMGKKQQDIIRELAIVWKSLPKSDKDVNLLVFSLYHGIQDILVEIQKPSV